jgi:GNAT superfamily N-acetyltransferase
MKIVTYRELKPKADIMMLMDMAFWWPISPQGMEEKITSDDRFKDGPVGFCAVEHDRLKGYVGVMDIPTKTASGKTEMVGGIWAVATNPAYARKGICKTLMEKAHQYFRSRDYRFSFLCTGRTIIAYRIYREMEYEEVDSVNQIKAVYKVLNKPKREKTNASSSLDSDRIFHIYQQFVQNKVGFALRQRDFAAMYAKRKRYDPKKSILKPKGYALLLDSENVTKVRDMTALDYDTYGELIDETEYHAQNGVVNGSVDDDKLVELYRSKGYLVQNGHNGVVMVKSLKEAGFEEVYGRSFYIGALDWF